MSYKEPEPPMTVAEATFESLCPFCDDYTDHIEDGDERICTECGDCVAYIDYIGERYVWVRHGEED